MQPTTHSQLFFREQLLLPLHHLIDLLNIQRNILHIITPLDAPIREDTLCNAACTEGYDRLQFLHDQNIVYAIFPVPCIAHVFKITGHIFLPVELIRLHGKHACALRCDPHRFIRIMDGKHLMLVHITAQSGSPFDRQRMYGQRIR